MKVFRGSNSVFLIFQEIRHLLKAPATSGPFTLFVAMFIVPTPHLKKAPVLAKVRKTPVPARGFVKRFRRNCRPKEQLIDKFNSSNLLRILLCMCLSVLVWRCPTNDEIRSFKF
jgi:hypothetical protein